MPIRMKQCEECHTLCSNSASKCHMCGSKKLSKGTFTTKQEAEQKEYERANKYTESECIQCSLCCSPVPIKDGKGECLYCGVIYMSKPVC